MPAERLLLPLPEDLVSRSKRVIPTRERSTVVRHLLEQALPPETDETDSLYLAALAVEQDSVLAAEMADWEAATLADGLADKPAD